MQRINNLLASKTIPAATAAKPLNPRYERAAIFAKRYNLPPVFILGLFKKYNEQRVLNLDSWLRDLNNFVPKKNGYRGIICWKLKQEAT